jgi:hypothetical protein
MRAPDAAQRAAKSGALHRARDTGRFRAALNLLFSLLVNFLATNPA